MSASLTKKMVLGTVTGLAVMAAAMAPASAHKHGKHRHILRWSAPVIITRTSGCSFYYWKWQDTGRAYWKRKYVYCLGY